MKFGEIAISDAHGAVIAHEARGSLVVLKKGDVVDDAAIALLRASSIETVVAARLDSGDVGENEAAQRLAERLAGDNIRVAPAFTGRCNLYARRCGLARIAAPRIDSFNEIDDALTLATLAPWRLVEGGDLVATLKIIPFAVSRPSMEKALDHLAEPAISVEPFRLSRIGVASTLSSSLKRSTIDKTLRVLAHRLDACRARIVACVETPHEISHLAAALGDIRRECEAIIIFGASAIADRRDTVPAALEAAGGVVTHFGMPVDPGNLLMLGDLDGAPVIGAPGCARSIKQNGFDLVLQRSLAGLPPTARDIRRMGVGGLLSETASRPQPRDGDGADTLKHAAYVGDMRESSRS